MTTKKKRTLLFCILFLATFYGCPYNPLPVGSIIEFFGWRPDGQAIISVENNLNTNLTNLVVTFDLKGQELKRVQLQKPISSIEDFDRLYFASDRNGFFAQVNNDIYLIDPRSGSEALLISGERFITASNSGKLILTSQDVNKDSINYFIKFMDMGNIRTISSLLFPKSTIPKFFETGNAIFIGDSLLTGCRTDTAKCSVTIFDTLFGIKYTTSDQDGFITPAFSSAKNQLFYLSSNDFSLFDLLSQSVKHIKSAPSHVLSIDISPVADFFIYTVSEDGRYFFYPSSMMLFDLRTNTEKKLFSGIASSAQLSPDGKSVAYSTNENNDVHLHVIPVP
jgi:hypothetical protein